MKQAFAVNSVSWQPKRSIIPGMNQAQHCQLVKGMDCPHAASPQVLYAVLGSTIGERWKTFRQNSNEGDKEGDKDDEGYRRQDM